MSGECRSFCFVSQLSRLGWPTTQATGEATTRPRRQMEDTTAVGTTSGSQTAPAPSTASVGASGATTTPDQRPTMAQAFATDAAAQAPETQAQPEAATTQPAEATDPQATNPSADKAGPIPFDVHSRALDNARTKAVEQFVQTKGINEAVDFATRIKTSAPGFWREYTTELLAHPEHGATLRSDLARMFGGLRNQAQPQADTMPAADVQIVDAQGQVTGETYSAKQLAARDAWTKKQLMAEVGQQLAPFQQERDARQKTEREAETQKQVAASVDHNLTRIDRILDGKTELYAQVSALMDADDALEAEEAAWEVRKTHIAPKLEGDAQKKVLDSLQTKAAAQGMNPASASPAASRRPKSFNDPSLSWS